MSIELTTISDGDLTAFKTALGAMGYPVPLSQGEISSPTPYFDVTIPDGYSHFKFELVGGKLSASDQLTCALSFDGGTTFLCDTNNTDSYAYSILGSSSGSTNPNRSASVALIGNTYGVTDPDVKITLATNLTLYPGSSDTFPMMIFGGSAGAAVVIVDGVFTSATLDLQSGISTLNPAAVVPPVAARTNLMRVLPFGNGDCNPPTSTNEFTAGTWVLSGFKIP